MITLIKDLLCAVCEATVGSKKVSSERSPESPMGGREIKRITFKEDIVVERESFDFCRFEDVYAKKVKFRNCSFMHCSFSRCYLRDSEFDLCDFTGASFTDCNLRKARLISCNLRYSTYYRTYLEDDIFEANLMSLHENERWQVARSLRTNAQSLGDAEAVNRFIHVELEATLTRWRKASFSGEKYYKNKYGGFWGRLKALRTYLYYRVGDILWGNGERPLRILGTIMVLIGILTAGIVATDIHHSKEVSSRMFWETALKLSLVFLGVTVQQPPHDLIQAVLVSTRYVALALFVGVLSKRLSRR